MKGWIVVIAVFLLLFPIAAQTIEGELNQKDVNLMAGSFVIRNAEKYKTYSVELWAAPITTKEFIRLENVEGNLGPGITGDHYINISFDPEILPGDWGSEIIFRYVLIPDEKISSEDFVMMVDRPGMAPDWFGENLTNSRYYTFGVMSMGEQPAASGKFTISFMITNTSNNPITLSWGTEASQIRYVNQNGGQSMAKTGQLYFGDTLARSGYYDIESGETVEGFVKFNVGVTSVSGIESGYITLNLANPSQLSTLRFQPAKLR